MARTRSALKRKLDDKENVNEEQLTRQKKTKVVLSESEDEQKPRTTRRRLKKNVDSEHDEDEKPRSKKKTKYAKKKEKDDEDFVLQENGNDDEDKMDGVVSEDEEDRVVEEKQKKKKSTTPRKKKKDEDLDEKPKKKKKKAKKTDSVVVNRLQDILKRREERAKAQETNPLPSFDPTLLVFTPRKQNDPPQERLVDEETHQQFVDLLSSHAIIERRILDEDEEMNLEDDDEESPKKGRKDGKKPTPFYQQVLDIKSQYPDMILFVELGHKFMFFGKDAEIASRVLGILQFHAFGNACACIPTFRLPVHLRRIVDAGYKCGLVRQTETGLVKAHSSNKAGPIERKLQGVFTKATMVGEEISAMDDSCGYLTCINEKIIDNDARHVQISIVTIDVSTGEILYDEFTDDVLRRNLETCLVQVPPAEILIPKSLSDHTQQCIDSNVDKGDRGVRIEKMDDLKYDWGITRFDIEEFYESTEDKYAIFFSFNMIREYLQEVKKHVFELPESVLSCLGVLVNYLKDFKLEGMLRMPGLQIKRLSSRFEMSINGVTLKNLELLKNSANGEEKGSLFWLMNNTCTPFGARLLKHWICHPLSDARYEFLYLLTNRLINDRYDAIEEINNTTNQPVFISSMPIFLRSLPDMEKALMRVQYGRCSPKEFLHLLKSIVRMFLELPTKEEIEQIRSPLLRNLFLSIPSNLQDFIQKFLESFNHDAVDKQNRGTGEFLRSELFLDKEGYPEIEEQKQELERLQEELNEYLEEVREVTGYPNLQFKNILGKYDVIELKIGDMGKAAKDWTKISTTKALVRFQAPFTHKYRKEVQLHEELLEAASIRAWNDLLRDFCAHYEIIRKTISVLAQLDCIFSLAEVSNKSTYVRPVFETGRPKLHVVNGRHPMVEVLLEESGVDFVPNNAKMDGEGERCMIITGPNMGGKSSYIKSMALIVLMAHVGAFVPADECVLTLYDAIYTRMGASDDMTRGHSTFFVELSEAGESLRMATERSLIVMDELGRGTSTHDGTAIAYATLENFVTKTECLTLFVTHYPLLTTLTSIYPSMIKNYHLSYSDVSSNVTFLYKLAPGPSPKSYGLNVAKLAGLSKAIVDRASVKSTDFERETNQRMVSKCFQKICGWMNNQNDSMEDIQQQVRELLPGIGQEQ